MKSLPLWAATLFGVAVALNFGFDRLAVAICKRSLPKRLTFHPFQLPQIAPRSARLPMSTLRVTRTTSVRP